MIYCARISVGSEVMTGAVAVIGECNSYASQHLDSLRVSKTSFQC